MAQGDGFLGAFLTLFGEAAGPRVVLRTGARTGDWIYVTGMLGGSLLGHHWRFVPRLAEGAWLARRGEVRAMMDVSDGLAKDLRALTPAGAGRRSTQPRFRSAPPPALRPRRTGRTPLHHALCDGEDYELVFAVTGRADRAALGRAWRRRFPGTRLTCIGRFVPRETVPPGPSASRRFTAMNTCGDYAGDCHVIRYNIGDGCEDARQRLSTEPGGDCSSRPHWAGQNEHEHLR